MAAKEEERVNSTTTDAKIEETPDNLTTEDPPTSLETIPEGNATRNELQIAPKDKSKSMISLLFTYNFTSVQQDILKKINFILILNFIVDILLKATANAPIMKQKKWSVCQDNPIGRISEFIKKYLKLDPNERLVH